MPNLRTVSKGLLVNMMQEVQRVLTPQVLSLNVHPMMDRIARVMEVPWTERRFIHLAGQVENIKMGATPSPDLLNERKTKLGTMLWSRIKSTLNRRNHNNPTHFKCQFLRLLTGSI